MSAIGDLLAGVAGDLNTAGLGVFDPTRVWTASDTATAVVIGPMPAAPDSVIVLAGYRLAGDSVEYPTATVLVQFRMRTPSLDPRPSLLVDGAVYDLFQGLKDRIYGATHVVQAIHKSSLGLGQDSNLRTLRSMNVAFDLDLPNTANRTY